MKSLHEAARHLPRELPPRRDLWPILERRAVRRARNRSLARWGGAVAGLLILAAVPAGLLIRGEADPDSPLWRAQAEYDRARDTLVRALNEQAREVDPAALEMVRRDLRTVDQDLTQIRRDVRSGPDPQARVAELAARYERDSTILEETAKLLSRPAAYWRE